MKRTGYFVLIALVLASCKSTDKVTSATGSKSQKKKVACGDMHVDMGQAHIDWYEENASVFNNVQEVVVLPKEYKVYAADSAQVANFFAAINDNQTVSTVVPLPKPADCRIFTMKNNAPGKQSGDNSITARGKSADQQMIMIYKDGKIEGEVAWFELTYSINTVEANDKLYYIVCF